MARLQDLLFVIVGGAAVILFTIYLHNFVFLLTDFDPFSYLLALVIICILVIGALTALQKSSKEKEKKREKQRMLEERVKKLEEELEKKKKPE